MPAFTIVLDIPAGTPKSYPVSEYVDCVPGILRRLTFFFPPGPQGEVGVRLCHNDNPIAPSRGGLWLAWDSGAVVIDVSYPLLVNDVRLYLVGHAEGAVFKHSVSVLCEVDTSEIPAAASPILNVIDRVGRLLGTQE